MLREIKDAIGFNHIELGHGIRISLMPGIQKMYEAGEVTFSSLHNFCPLPLEVTQASPDGPKFSAGTSAERERAVKQTFRTIDAAVVVSCALFAMSRVADFTLTAIAMGILAIALSLNFGLAGTIVQERAPAHLRGRISAVFGLSFFGLMPIAGLLTTGLSDLIGMRAALAVASVFFGAGALFVMNLAKRNVDGVPVETAPAPEPAPAPVSVH